jgi:endonuclease-3 related protein
MGNIVESADLGRRLVALYNALDEHFGHEPHWWPIISPTPAFEQLVGAILVQQTRWETVERAIVRLLERGWLEPTMLAAAPTDELANLIRPCAFHTQKAPGLQAICQYLLETCNGEIERLLAGERQTVRTELLRLPRIGRETADTMMLYAGSHPCFIVDAYARRLLQRVDPWPGFDWLKTPYDQVQLFVETALLDHGDLGLPLREFHWRFHALITEACIHHCLASNMRCDLPGLQRRAFYDPKKCALHCVACQGCPLRVQCAVYQQKSSLAIE